ncbi:hypothetical protein [Nocardioides bruguierae]|uniref:Uncharacterized protein n=1 Tax=Nocardioides bruguierae TaxID=2945102 RepID=A0A9X2D728_9ACTN|nr:hypothetical protein [Nocardioides bruguierae]MCL8023980.1 hypothetical protein [Nocardioides bruguierae]MCM0620356.1 hypothetical protein [Nocardioides bruguierae]
MTPSLAPPADAATGPAPRRSTGPFRCVLAASLLVAGGLVPWAVIGALAEGLDGLALYLAVVIAVADVLLVGSLTGLGWWLRRRAPRTGTGLVVATALAQLALAGLLWTVNLGALLSGGW